jgi:hypothetical protein
VGALDPRAAIPPVTILSAMTRRSVNDAPVMDAASLTERRTVAANVAANVGGHAW